jgi:hypothetical protein
MVQSEIGANILGNANCIGVFFLHELFSAWGAFAVSMYAVLILRPARFAVRVSLFAACIGAAGCIPVPSLQTRESGIQGAATQTNRVLGVTVLRAVTFVSGSSLKDKTTVQVSECGVDQIRVSVSFRGIEPVPSDIRKQLCSEVVESVHFIDALVGSSQRPPRQYEIYLVPWGTRYSKSTVSLSPPGKLRLVFAAYWFPHDVRKTMAYVLNTVAHETAHLWSHIESIRERNDQAEEQMAYTAGTCAQLQVEGKVETEDLGWIELADAMGQMHTSSMASVRQSRLLSSLFKDGILSLDSEKGKMYADQCQSEVRRYFKP